MVNAVAMLWVSLKKNLADQRGQAFLWAPVCLGGGIAAYFSAQAEPRLGLAWAGAALCAACVVRWRQNLALRALLLMILGFALAASSARLYGTPMLDHPVGPVRMEGTVVDVEKHGNGWRFLVEDVFVSNRAPNETPHRVHLVLGPDTAAKQKNYHVRPGDHLEASVELLPLSQPVAPGSFDFRRNGFFQGLGATGYILGKMELGDGEQTNGFSMQVAANQMRQRLQQEILRTLSGDQAGLAIILLTGDKSYLSEAATEAMRAVGLAHLLAIAGLHVGVVAGIVFFLSRFLMALVPTFALRYPIKKIAAFLALLAIVFYAMQVGAPVPTRRALVMTGLVLLAVMADRASFSLHTIALAGFVLLAVWPFLLLHPAFQLSFAAVSALIAVHGMCKRDAKKHLRGPLGRGATYVGKLGLMSFVATVATLPAALFHFQEAEIYSVLANTLAVPLTAFVLMPLCVLTDLLWPLGLAALPLKLAGPGIGILIQIATSISELPFAHYKPPAMPMGHLAAAALGIAAFCFLKTRLRWVGAGVVVGAVVWTCAMPRPAVFISPDGKTVGWVDGAQLVLTTEDRPQNFLALQWAPLAGVGAEQAVFSDQSAHVACDDQGCAFDAAQSRVVWVKDPVALQESCARTSDLILSFNADLRCADGRGYTREDLRRGGALALYREGDGYLARFERRGNSLRPWDNGWGLSEN